MGPADGDLVSNGRYDSFLREAARVTDGAPAAGKAPLRAGARLSGTRFEIERPLGSGGMGVVYAAHDHQRGCAVAIKTLRAPTLDALHRLRDEFLVLHDLAHPNLVSLGELFDDDGHWFFSMELVDGVDFLAHVRPGGALDVAQLRSAIAQLAAGIGFLHAAGKVHRDVKPSNVLCAGDRVVLLDFGLASEAGRDSCRSGTLPYMAPEQHDRAPVGPTADWYAVGVMLWAALAGRLPFVGPDAVIAARKRRGAPAVEGPADLVALAVRLLDPDPARRPSEAEIAERIGAPAPPSVPVMPFVGRERELAALRRAANEGPPGARVVLVRGPSGVGKSALLARFADELRAEGALVAVGRCHERVAMPYKAVHGIAAALAARLRDDRRARAAAAGIADAGLLPAVFPSLIEVGELARASRTAPAIRDPQQRRARVFDAFAALIGRLAELAPVVLMIDDLQWADRDGLALLEHVATASSARVLVLAAARDGELDRDAAWLAAGARVDVGGLDPADAQALARGLVGDEAAGAIAREATGHPLHIAELARHWQRGATAAALRLDDAIAERARALPADQARVLGLIAIAGALPQEVIGDAAALGGAAWWSALAALRASNLVRTHGPRGADAVEPYHDRVRETVAAGLAHDVLVDGHTRLAAALEARGAGDDRPDLLAYHLEGAEQPSAAARWTERAAEQAARALAFDRAAELYRRTLALISARAPRAPAPATEVSLHTRRGDALTNAGRGAPAAEAYLAGAALVAGDEALELRRRAAEQLLRSGRIDDGIGVLDGVLRDAGLPGVARRWPIASLIGQRALLRFRRWRGAARGTGTADQQRQLACTWSALCGLAMVSPLRTAEYQTRHLRLALAANDPRHIALGVAFEASFAAMPGPPAPRADALLREARSWAAQVDSRLAEAYVTMAEGTIAFLCGRWRDALALCDSAERIFRRDCVGVAWEIGTVYRMSLTALWHMGRITELGRRLGRALDEADRRGDLYAATQLRTVLQPNLCLMEDREAAARAELARAEAALTQRETTMQHWQHMQASALVELYAGAPARAVELMDRRLPAMRRAFLLRVQAVRNFTMFVRVAGWLGTLATGAPDAERFVASVARACEGVASDPEPGTTAAVQLVRAELAVLHGDLDTAAVGYRAAATGFDVADMALVAESARWRLGELIAGDGGATLIGRASAALRAEGIVRPDRVVAMFVPVAHDARLAHPRARSRKAGALARLDAAMRRAPAG